MCMHLERGEVSDLLARLAGLAGLAAGAGGIDGGAPEAAAAAVNDGEFHPRRMSYPKLERLVRDFCTALTDLQVWVEQLQGTGVSRHVGTVGFLAGGARRYLDGGVSYPRNWDLRAIMSELEAAYEAMNQLSCDMSIKNE